MTRAIGTATRFSGWWVGLYTLGLQRDTRGERRDEIASDLWEQAHDKPSRLTAMAILLRCLLGIPADLSWRVEQARIGELPVRILSSVLSMIESSVRWLNRRGLPGLTVIVAVLSIVLGIALVVTAGQNQNRTSGGAVAGGILFMVAGSFMLAGRQAMEQQPRVGAVMTTLGVLPVGLVFFATGIVPIVALVVIAATWRNAIIQHRTLAV